MLYTLKIQQVCWPWIFNLLLFNMLPMMMTMMKMIFIYIDAIFIMLLVIIQDTPVIIWADILGDDATYSIFFNSTFFFTPSISSGDLLTGILSPLFMTIMQVSSWEPEGRYRCSTMFRWEPEGRYPYTEKSMSITTFWFSMEYHWTALTPFWLSTDD